MNLQLVSPSIHYQCFTVYLLMPLINMVGLQCPRQTRVVFLFRHLEKKLPIDTFKSTAVASCYNLLDSKDTQANSHSPLASFSSPLNDAINRELVPHLWSTPIPISHLTSPTFFPMPRFKQAIVLMRLPLTF